MFKGDITPPKGTGVSFRYEHYYCDFVEMLALVNGGDLITLSDVKSRFEKDVDLGLDPVSDLDVDISKSDSSEVSQGGRYYAEVADKWDDRISVWFSIMRNRECCYGSDYPFKVVGNTVRLKKFLNAKEKTYIFLLACSMLEKFKNTDQLTSLYELVCAKAMRNYLPVIAQVHVFGKSAHTSPQFKGSKFEKIQQLSRDLGVRHVNDASDYDVRDSGDGGLDIVAWVPFRDDLNKSKVDVYICQCASGKNWIDKQDEPRKITTPLPQLKDAKGVVFIPYDIRSLDSSFFHKTELTASLIIDRHRLCKLLNHINDSWFYCTVGLKEMVSEIISYREPMF